MTIVTTTPIECHRCNLIIPVGEEVTLTQFGWVHPVCDISNALKAAAESNGASLMFSDKLGFSGTCPSNLGTGLRASVMV